MTVRKYNKQNNIDIFWCRRSVSPKSGSVTVTMTVGTGQMRRMVSVATSHVIKKLDSGATTTNVFPGGVSVIKWTTVEMDQMKTTWISVRHSFHFAMNKSIKKKIRRKCMQSKGKNRMQN